MARGPMSILTFITKPIHDLLIRTAEPKARDLWTISMIWVGPFNDDLSLDVSMHLFKVVCS